MKHLKTWALVTAATLTTLLIPNRAIAFCRADLTRQIDTIAQQPSLKKARIGIRIETQAGEVIYSRDADRYFVPASNIKLLTTAAALSSLGPNFT
ncbi:MAG: D-alanyl-D-alanine carboxypeptidase/D-alanyl-D-alanine-endopeptidase, partial [Leptolyngbya sp. SIO3F4]|nr:D-alanyl-D-alanine carboxypeptidase/D-alanyl-D-alanine-endopeptidase [Leptolyngbya sp. SIO3F4]